MKCTLVDETLFRRSKRWNADFFLEGPDDCFVASGFTLITLGELVFERREFLFPRDYPDYLLNYVGLENISQSTRLLVDFSPRKGSEIKSRSKVFRSGDVLYGRLRPGLNKCLIVDDFLVEGICSTEIFVLIPNLNLIHPEYLAELLVSERVRSRVSSLVAGSALPRVQLSDFLSIEVPIPELDIQRKVVVKLREMRLKFERYLHNAHILPKCIAEAFAKHAYKGEAFELEEMIDFERKRWNSRLPVDSSGELFN